MNILFVTLLNIATPDENNIYTDLLREFHSQGHNIYIVAAAERRNGIVTNIKSYPNGTVLQIQTGNIQKTNVIEKGISTLLLERQFIQGIKKYLRNIHFDLILYSTPPITLYGAVRFIKKRDNAISYLLLKDIFPQNAVDLGLFPANGLIHAYFRAKEKQLYRISDHIGCMSPANVHYLLEHNPEISKDKVSVCPNAIAPGPRMLLTDEQRAAVRARYGIPPEAVAFVYGGNLGKPQDIPFLIECLKANQNVADRFFVVCGTGSEYSRLARYISEYSPQNVLLLSGLPYDEYANLIRALDVGLVFLDNRFTIPNFPSRLLTYMECALPVLACTDVNTDVGATIVNGGFGWWCESVNASDFTDCVNAALHVDLRTLGLRSREYLEQHYTVQQAYLQIIDF